MKNIGNSDLIKKSIKIFNKYIALESMPKEYISGVILYPSQMHTIEIIGKNPNLNVTEIAKELGVSKGTISKALRTLEKKELITRFNKSDNQKEVFIRLTTVGKKAFNAHEAYHQNFYDRINEYLKRLNENEKKVIQNFLDTSDKLLDEFINLAEED